MALGKALAETLEKVSSKNKGFEKNDHWKMENLYDKSAKFYDLRYRSMQFAKYRNALPYVHLKGKILDHGCGTGLLHEHLKYFDMIGVDNSREMLRIAESKGEKVKFGDIHDLPFEDGEFDFVLSFTTLQNSDKPETALREIRRVLKNNGSAIISFIHQFQKKLEPLIKQQFKIIYFFRNVEDVTYICKI